MPRRLCLLALVVLAACSTPDRQRLADHEQCLDFGFEAWTADYGYCRLALYQQREGMRALVLLPPKRPRDGGGRLHRAADPPPVATEPEATVEPPNPLPAPRDPVSPRPPPGGAVPPDRVPRAL